MTGEIGPQPHANLIQTLEHRAQEFLSDRRRFLGAVLGIMSIIQVDALVIAARDDRPAETLLQAVECVEPVCIGDTGEIFLAGEQMALIPAPTTTEAPEVTTTLAATTTTVPVAPPVTSVPPPAAPPAPPAEIRAASSEALAPALNPETQANIDAMRLSVEGYQAFMANIDTSMIDYARQFPEFDPSLNGFRQDRRIEWVTVHHTANYANAAGISTVPEGEVDPRVLIEMMATRGDEEGDHRCCAVQFFNDRNGKMWQFTSRSARVRHDKRYEEVSIGLETEGIDETFTPRQFENIVYWTIATTEAEALLGNAPLERIIRGHEEARNEWNANNPNDRQPSKQDGDPGIMNRLRDRISQFLQEHPEVLEIPVTIQ